MKTGDAVAILVLVGSFVGLLGYRSLTGYWEEQEKRPAAVAAGFTDHREMEKAAAAGISTGADWAAKLERDRQAAVAAEAARKEANRNPATKMSIDTIRWTKTGFGTIAEASLTIANDNDFPIKDITLDCEFVGNSGTVITKRSHTIYDTMKPKSKRTFKDVNVGFVNSQAARGGCSVDSAKRL